MDMDVRLVFARREGKGMGWIGHLELEDANCCIWSGQALEWISNEVLLYNKGTISNHL